MTHGNDRRNDRQLGAPRRLVLGGLAGAAIGGGAPAARASQFPTGPLRQIHAFAPGSSTDNAGRLIAKGLGERLGQTVVVLNRPGANGIIGTEAAARSEPDGHTLVMIYPDNVAINPNLYVNLGYDPLRDFVPLTLIGKLPLALIGRPDIEAADVAALIAASKGPKGPLTFGTWGVGSANHMLMEMFRALSGLAVTYVPFQGAAPSNNAVLGGHVDLTITSAAGAASFLGGGRAKVFAVGAARRLPAMPAVPTFAELGFAAFDCATWHGIAVRRGGPPGSVERLHREIVAVMGEPENRTTLLNVGYEEISGMPQEAFRAFVESEIARWGRAVADSGVERVVR